MFRPGCASRAVRATGTSPTWLAAAPCRAAGAQEPRGFRTAPRIEHL